MAKKRGRKPGCKKTGGRTKGVPNKRNQNLIDLAADLDINPIEILLKFAAGDFRGLGYASGQTTSEGGTDWVISPEMRLQAAAKVAPYLYPKRKAVEINTSAETLGDLILKATQKPSPTEGTLLTGEEALQRFNKDKR
jgi:hypothetical protein